MTHRVHSRPTRVLFSVVIAVALGLGCGDDDDAAGASDTYCCVLRQLADHCAGRDDDATDWKTVGDSHNGDACKIYLDNHNLGCSNFSSSYSEDDAVLDCVK